MPRPPSEIDTLAELRRATSDLPQDEREDFLWSVIEGIFPSDAHHTWTRWKMVLPSAVPQRFRMMDILWRRRGHIVTSQALMMAMHGVNWKDKDNGSLRKRLSELRLDLIVHRVPIAVASVSGGYMLVLIGEWEPPWRKR